MWPRFFEWVLVSTLFVNFKKYLLRTIKVVLGGYLVCRFHLFWLSFNKFAHNSFIGEVFLLKTSSISPIWTYWGSLFVYLFPFIFVIFYLIYFVSKLFLPFLKLLKPGFTSCFSGLYSGTAPKLVGSSAFFISLPIKSSIFLNLR